MDHAYVAHHFSKAVALPTAYAQFGDESEGSGCHLGAARRLFEASRPFLERLPLSRGDLVLDVGSGYGWHSRYFVSRGCVTTALTFHLSADLLEQSQKVGYRMMAGDMHALPFGDQSFDLVWSHHSLEHSHCAPGLLLEWYGVARPGGWLAVSVSPHKSDIVSGHFHTGWSVGQLVYLLGVAGFDLRAGFFVQEGYNIRALVRRPEKDVDPTGLSWLSVLRDRLPRALLPHLVEQPASLGCFSFPGHIRYLDDSRCELP